MKTALLSLSLRTRLLLASVLVQIVMLALLIVNGISVMNERLTERTRVQLEEQKQLLNAALATPLAQRNYAMLQEVFERVRHDNGITYLVLFDRDGKIIAASGWERTVALPPLDRSLNDEGSLSKGRFDTELKVGRGDREEGRLRFGLSTDFMQKARAELIRDNLLIGGIALVLSIIAMIGLSYWLTRSLIQLTRASASLASGDLNVRLPVEGGDEVGRLTHAFNAMAAALQGRLKALVESEAKFSAIADYSYDCELWLSPEAKLIWINPRVS